MPPPDDSTPPRPDPPRSNVRLDGRQIRALAHPVRARLLAALRTDGPATATGLADLLGTNSGNTSYHLRQLAEVGLVAEEATRGRGRERWWRSVHRSSSWRSTDFDDDPDARAASEWFDDFIVRGYAEEATNWNAAKRDWSDAWRDAAAYHDCLLTITPDRLRQLNQELTTVIKRYLADPAPAGEQTEKVLLILHAFPRVAGPPAPMSPEETGWPEETGRPETGTRDEERA
ncbi:winged helix-turn-helix domain-containing protein [Micromonospora sp. NPDC050397]|uniref:winged helix-turn-helix domain-containing protein n=1 Tax=Micromonospora sp. NPDC050397 TaxID=3364279 RepID=UPI00384EECC7